nr:expressed protein [Hymenolepis microstoma]
MPAHLLPCFPLSGKKVFLHLIRSDQLTRILSRLGVDVRPFFDRSVEVVIYNPEARQSPTSTQCVQPASSLPPLSRGRAMVMAANQGTTPRQHDVISQARTLGIRLIALEEIRGWIRELPENVLRAISGNDEEPSSEYFDPDIDRRFEVRPLQGSAVKVTDRRNPFRPLYAENTNFVRGLWPCIRELIPSNPSCPTDPAAGPSRPVSGSERIPRPLTFTTQISGQSRRTAVPSTLTQPPIAATICQTTAATRIVPSGSRQAESPAATGHTGSEKRLSKSKKREEPSGYCELCATHFPNLYEHLHSIEHMDFANNSENFRGIDNAISAFQGMEQDLRQYLQSKVHQASSSVIQSPSLTPGRSDTGPGAPVSRTSDLPPQRVGVGHKDVHSKPVSELFPPPPPLTPIYRLPPEHAANIQPLFSDDDPSMFRQSQDYYDSAGFESSVPPIPREEPNPNFSQRSVALGRRQPHLIAQDHVFDFSRERSRIQRKARSNCAGLVGTIEPRRPVRTEPVIHVPERPPSQSVAITYAGSFPPVQVVDCAEYAEPSAPFDVIEEEEEFEIPPQSEPSHHDEYQGGAQEVAGFLSDVIDEGCTLVPIIPIEHFPEGSSFECAYVSQDEILESDNGRYLLVSHDQCGESSEGPRAPTCQSRRFIAARRRLASDQIGITDYLNTLPREIVEILIEEMCSELDQNDIETIEIWDSSSDNDGENCEPEQYEPVEMQSGSRTRTQGNHVFNFSSQMRSTQQSPCIDKPIQCEPEEMETQDPCGGSATETYDEVIKPEPSEPVEVQTQDPCSGGATETPGTHRCEFGETQTCCRSRADICGSSCQVCFNISEQIGISDETRPATGNKLNITLCLCTNTHQIRATSDQQRQDVPTTGNTLALPDARGAENEENQNQSSNDFSSSNSVQIGGRFRSCRKCGIAHIPSAVAPDLLQKMSQYIPGRDIDSFCPRAPPDPESDIQTNQNASVDSRPSSRILDGVEPNGKQLGKSINRSPILNDVPVVEEDHLVPIDDRSLNQSPVFEEEERIQKNFNHSILQFLNRMPPSKVFGNSPLLEGCERIDSPADSIHSNESAELRKEDGHSLPITSSHKSSILEDTSETLPMAYEQHRSYVCDEDVPEENEPLEQSNPGERHYPSVLDGQIVPEESEHSSSVQSPQRSPILEDDETASLSRFEKVQPNIEGYHSLLELDNESSLSRFPCLQRPLSPEVASLAGPREHVEEQERRKTRLPRRASLVAREAIGLSMQALFTPTKLTSDRIFEKSHSQSYDKWSVDSSSNNDSCKLILRRVNRKSQTHVESVSSYSSPHARSLPLILQSPQTKSNISASLSSIEETEDDKIDTSKASKSEETCVNTLTDSWNDSKETPRPRSRKSLALRERNGNIFSDDDTTSPTQSNLTRRRTFTHNITDSPSDKENKGDTSTSKGVWRLLTFNSSDTTSAITDDNDKTFEAVPENKEFYVRNSKIHEKKCDAADGEGDEQGRMGKIALFTPPRLLQLLKIDGEEDSSLVEAGVK